MHGLTHPMPTSLYLYPKKRTPHSGCVVKEIRAPIPMAISSSSTITLVAFFFLLLLSPLIPVADSIDPCSRTDFKPLCRAIAKGDRSPAGATTKAIRAAVLQANVGKALAVRLTASSRTKLEKATASTCRGLYEDIISDLSQSFGDLKSRDVSGLNDKLSSVLANVDACNEGYMERGRPSPFSRVNTVLRQLASNCLALTALVH